MGDRHAKISCLAVEIEEVGSGQVRVTSLQSSTAADGPSWTRDCTPTKAHLPLCSTYSCTTTGITSSMSDTEYVREKSREALRKALENGASKMGVSSASDTAVASSSVIASRIEAAMLEHYGRDLSLERSRAAANESEGTVAEEMVTQRGDLVATEAYRQAVRAHVTTLTSYNPKLAALLVDGDLAPDTFAVMSPQDMMSSSMHKHAEETKKECTSSLLQKYTI